MLTMEEKFETAKDRKLMELLDRRSFLLNRLMDLENKEEELQYGELAEYDTIRDEMDRLDEEIKLVEDYGYQEFVWDTDTEMNDDWEII